MSYYLERMENALLIIVGSSPTSVAAFLMIILCTVMAYFHAMIIYGYKTDDETTAKFYYLVLFVLQIDLSLLAVLSTMGFPFSCG